MLEMAGRVRKECSPYTNKNDQRFQVLKIAKTGLILQKRRLLIVITKKIFVKTNFYQMKDSIGRLFCFYISVFR